MVHSPRIIRIVASKTSTSLTSRSWAWNEQKHWDRTHVADISNPPLPFEENTFDVVTLIEVVEHLYDPTSVQ
jgi:2-polyprenyl-3-methyl-5-hydroxy-6-metoxy-1,4-benzoquinol methylase